MLNIRTMPEIILVSRNGGPHHELLGAHKVGCTVPSTSNGRWLRSILYASSGTIQISSMQRCAAGIIL